MKKRYIFILAILFAFTQLFGTPLFLPTLEIDQMHSKDTAVDNCAGESCQLEKDCAEFCLAETLEGLNEESFVLLTFLLLSIAVVSIIIIWQRKIFSLPYFFVPQPLYLFNTVRLLE